jgi:hypothetical protein
MRVRNMSRSLIIILFLCLITLPAVTKYAHGDPISVEIERVKTDPTFHKKIDGFALSLTSEQMTYLLDHLPVTSILLNEYGIHTLRIRDTGPDTFHAEDESGLEGVFTLVSCIDQGSGNMREYSGNGWIENKVISRISADVIARIGYEEPDAGHTVNELEFWVSVDGLLLDILCRIFRPVLLSVLTKKFDDFILVVQRFTAMLQEDSVHAEGILQKSGRNDCEIEEFTRVFSIP